MSTFNVDTVLLTVSEVSEAVRRAIEKHKRIIALEGDVEEVRTEEYLEMLIEEETNKIAFEKACDKINKEREKNHGNCKTRRNEF